jgi:hypothetical protein
MYPIDIEGAPKIILGGKPWAIPELAIGQAMYVVPALTSIMPILGRMLSAVTAGPDGKVAVDEKQMMALIGMIDAPTFAAMADAVYWALRRAVPGIARGEFDQIPIKVTELFAALPIILKQVGFIEAAKPAAGDVPTAGEVQAAPVSTGNG